ncbi:hypothetical protein LRY65_00640 [Candidatus Woesebacteria bacterium]|nr:hypothetical protein [Candidatus Woesebacteria bacterium]MCD8507218.1 hypothetical protein [Candidatus Woesebacteria bacterium]MCD8526706.1 hypothetical protein [Candidatus Woesebacteria bacterium]MCD8546550.1 hypothetical protein [Candidatus Woesebacteria bacterium]
MAFTIQPTGLEYFQKKQSVHVPAGVAHRFYASWEDGLWDLLRVAAIPSGSTVLVPEFFCQDVVDNMASHGLEAVWYPVDENFQTEPETFAYWLEKYQPAVVVILHTVGITNQLFQHNQLWKDSLPPDSLLIEDSVHRVLKPEDVHLLHDRHVVMDSLRKVVPVAGSNMYGSPEFLTYEPTPFFKTLLYQIALFGWWAVFQLWLSLARLPLGKMWNRYMNLLAEWAMLEAYEIIGDNFFAGRAWNIFPWMAKHIAFHTIEQKKSQQVDLYQRLLSPVWSQYCQPVVFPPPDASRLRAFPVRLEIPEAQRILQILRKNGILVRFELNDNPWSTKRKVIYLPLGPHLTDNDIHTICHELTLAVETMAN